MFVDLTWESFTRCLTPTLLFLLLNLMIATIALISKINTQNHHQNKPQPTIATSPSLHTLSNLNTQSRDFSQEVSESSFRAPQSQADYLFDESPERTETLFFSEPKESIPDDSRNEQDQLSMDEIYSNLTTNSHFTKPSGDLPAKLSARMGKSASLKAALGRFEEEEIVEARRPATAREAKVTDGDAEVDAKADDFINRFREQLKLQRVESVIKFYNNKNDIMSEEVNVI